MYFLGNRENMHYFYSKYSLNGFKLTFLREKLWKKCHSTQKYSFVISKRVVEISHFWEVEGIAKKWYGNTSHSLI